MSSNRLRPQAAAQHHIERELKDLRIFDDAAYFFANLTRLHGNDAAAKLEAGLVESEKGTVSWNGATMNFESHPQNCAASHAVFGLYDYEITIILAYVARLHELTDSSLHAVLSRSPAAHYLALARSVRTLDTQWLVRDGVPVELPFATSSVRVDRHCGRSATARTTFAFDTIHVEVVASNGAVLISAPNEKACHLRWDVLALCVLDADEVSPRG